MNKIILGIIGVVAVVSALMYFNAQNKDSASLQTPNTIQTTQDVSQQAVEGRMIVAPGSYTVDISKSTVNWAGKKPLIDGYINSGTLGLTSGSIVVSDNEATGSFAMDMNALKVGLTAKKPDQETKLEEHLKGERWFDVAKYPTASFVITSVIPRTDSATTFEYDVIGQLTMKGATNEVRFKATIYQTSEGVLFAEAATEIDRTKWGITAGSKSFFDNLADNVVDDMIGLSFTLVATK